MYINISKIAEYLKRIFFYYGNKIFSFLRFSIFINEFWVTTQYWFYMIVVYKSKIIAYMHKKLPLSISKKFPNYEYMLNEKYFLSQYVTVENHVTFKMMFNMPVWRVKMTMTFAVALKDNYIWPWPVFFRRANFEMWQY